jgi:hypothetical protein
MAKILFLQDELRRRLKEMARREGPGATTHFTKKQLEMMAGSGGNNVKAEQINPGSSK